MEGTAEKCGDVSHWGRPSPSGPVRNPLVRMGSGGSAPDPAPYVRLRPGSSVSIACAEKVGTVDLIAVAAIEYGAVPDWLAGAATQSAVWSSRCGCSPQSSRTATGPPARGRATSHPTTVGRVLAGDQRRGPELSQQASARQPGRNPGSRPLDVLAIW